MTTPDRIRTTLKRLRLPLDPYDAELVLVGDMFDEGGRYVQQVVSRQVSAEWNWLDWDNTYDRLAAEWQRRFGHHRPDLDSYAPVIADYDTSQLYAADPNCDHEAVAQRSGVKCRLCPGWFCY